MAASIPCGLARVFISNQSYFIKFKINASCTNSKSYINKVWPPLVFHTCRNRLLIESMSLLMLAHPITVITPPPFHKVCLWSIFPAYSIVVACLCALWGFLLPNTPKYSLVRKVTWTNLHCHALTYNQSQWFWPPKGLCKRMNITTLFGWCFHLQSLVRLFFIIFYITLPLFQWTSLNYLTLSVFSDSRYNLNLSYVRSKPESRIIANQIYNLLRWNPC